MNTREKNVLYVQALHLWGIKMQLLILIEECAELSHACSKKIRDIEAPISKIAEEIADVEIMCEQIKVIWSLRHRVGKMKEDKLRRLKQLIEIGGIKQNV